MIAQRRQRSFLATIYRFSVCLYDWQRCFLLLPSESIPISVVSTSKIVNKNKAVCLFINFQNQFELLVDNHKITEQLDGCFPVDDISFVI